MSFEVKVPTVGESITEGILLQWFRQEGDIVQMDDDLFELETDKITLPVKAEVSGKLSIHVAAGETVQIDQLVASIDPQVQQTVSSSASSALSKKTAHQEEPTLSTSSTQSTGSPIDIVIPPVGDSIHEGTILGWEVQQGGFVEKDGVLFELETDKITMPITSEVAGIVSVLAEAGQVVKIGEVVARVQPASAASPSAKEAVLSTPKTEAQVSSASQEVDGRVASPAGRFAMAQHGLSAQDVQGTGKEGRIMKGDVLQHLQKPAAPKPAAQTTDAPKAPVASAASSKQPTGERQRREKMTPIRKRIAERLLQAQHTAAILTTFNEVDLTQAMAYRKRYQEAFEKRHGIKLGFMSFFVKAVVLALKEVPAVNAFIDGDEIVYNNFYDIGIAVGTPKGLVVPVVRDAEQLGFAGVEKEIGALAKKARDRKLTLEDLTGGSFTITNGGVYGSLISTPILNPPQSAILGMHGIKKRPMVINDKIEIRPMMYLALSYDHRIIDGKEAVTFLKRVVECVEDPERLLLEV